MGKYKIYGLRIIGTEEIKYIGRTMTSLANRWSKHKTNARIDAEKINNTNYRVNWINKHKDEIEIFLIEGNIETKEESCIKEIKYIEEYSKIYELVNSSKGGEGGNEGYKHSDETIKKMKKSTKGVPRPYVSIMMTNRVVTEETRKKLSDYGKTLIGEKNPMYGKKREDVVKRNKDRTGWKQTEEAKEKMRGRTGEKNSNYKTGKYTKAEKDKKKRIYKLTKENVIKMREMWDNKELTTYKEVADYFNIPPTYASAVIRKVKWKNV